MFHLLFFIVFSLNFIDLIRSEELVDNTIENNITPCTCGIFLSGQFKKFSKEQPIGNPSLLQEFDHSYPNNTIGVRQCTNKCLETIVKHLASSAPIICATIDRDCQKERAYLFIQNCTPLWHNTNLSAGREYCCKDNEPYKCPF